MASFMEELRTYEHSPRYIQAALDLVHAYEDVRIADEIHSGARSPSYALKDALDVAQDELEDAYERWLRLR